MSPSVSRYAFALAESVDDADLRARMAADHMTGAIAVSFRREPSYFAGCRVQGDHAQVVKCTDTRTGALVGLGTRSTLLAYVDGAPRRIGYLSDLRVAAQYRRGTLLARGYRYFRRLHEQDPVSFYTTVIYEGNAPALNTLVGGRAGLPDYVDWGRVLTPAIHLDFGVRACVVPDVAIERGSIARLPEIVEFLNRWQRHKQFAPVYRLEDFGNGRFHGIAAEDFFLAVKARRVVGTIAAWDQGAFRQAHVERYTAGLAAMRPVYNALSRVSPLKPLPRCGERIPYVYLACIATEEDDLDIFRCLLRATHDALRHGSWHFAIAGLHETDPRAQVLTELRHIRAAGRLFVAHFPGEDLAIAPPAERVPYVEAGCL